MARSGIKLDLKCKWLLIYLIYLIFSHTRNVAFKNSKHCENKEEMRYENANSLKEAALFAVDMIEKWSL